MVDPLALDAQIDRERNSLRTDKLDITYGELASMYERTELVIEPDYQRLFRWNDGQKARFLESILLGFPIPAIFVAETDKGIWELVDGMQRVSTVLEFMGLLKSAEGATVPPSRATFAEGRPRLPQLDGMCFEELTLRSRLAIKRASCRVEVIKVGSAPKMKYEVFERLNTGGSSLTDQEVRNCIFRATNPDFMAWVDSLAALPAFSDHLGLSEFQEASLYDRGLVLRYFTLKDSFESFTHDVEPFITEFVRETVEGSRAFEREAEESAFRATFERIEAALGDDAYRHYRGNRHKGPFSVYVFDALSVGIARNLATVGSLSNDHVRERCLALKVDPRFMQNTGAGANIRSRLLARLNAAIEIFSR